MTDTYDIRTSQYDHPDAPRGQHTNGPAKLFVRRPGGPWYRVRYHAQHKVRLLIAIWLRSFRRDSLRPIAIGAAPVTHDYHGPCTILLDRSTTVDVRRGGRVESVAMPNVDTPHDEPSVK